MKNLVELDGTSYIKDVTAFKVRNRWVPLDKLEKDNFTGQFDLKSNLLPYTDFDNKTKYTSCLVKINLGKKVIELCKNEIIDNIDSFIVMKDQYYFLGHKYEIPVRSRFSPSTKVYSVDNASDTVGEVPSIENNLSFLSKYTFGVELETTGSSIKSLASEHGFYELYDGSINGPEYASRVLRYDNLHIVERFLLILRTLSDFNGYCSLHIHIGNIEYSSDNLCAIYSLFQRLQEDLNLLIAPYKKDYNFLYGKQKDHCKNLPLIPNINEDSILTLFKLNPGEDYSNDHPIHKTSKWNLEGRYYAVNFLNYICKDYPDNTIEIRSLQMTFNYDYFLTWLIINVSIIDYAIKNTKKILNKKEKIQVEDCLVDLPSDILETILFNYRTIKNKIYSLKYINGNLNPNIRVDDHLQLRSIFPSKIKIDTELLLKLNNVKAKSIAASYDYSNYFRLTGVVVEHPGGWTYPTERDCNILLTSVISGILDHFAHNNLHIGFNENYFLDGNDIVTHRLSSVYNSHTAINHYVLVEGYDVTYIASFMGKKIAVTKTIHTDGIGEDLDEI
jgi:hypothetical protein